MGKPEYAVRGSPEFAALAAQAFKAGMVFTASPEDLELPTRGDGVLHLFQGLPREATLRFLCALAAAFHAHGDISRDLQLSIAEMMPTKRSRRRALTQVHSAPNCVVASYEAVVRCSLLAMSLGTDDVLPLADEDIRRIIGVLPEVVARLSRLETLENPALIGGSLEAIEDTALTTFLMANSPGMLDPTRGDLEAAGMGSRIASAHYRAMQQRRNRAARVAAEGIFGCSFEDAHAAAVNVALQFQQQRKRFENGQQAVVWFDHTGARAHGHALGALSASMVDAITVTDPPPFQSLADVLKPRPSLDARVRWRPFVASRADPDRAWCWDVRMLGQMTGGMFREWLNQALKDHPQAAAQASTEWGNAVEDALDDYVTPLLPTWQRITAGAGSNADRCFVEMDDLFVVEIKNVAPTDGTWTTPSVHGLKLWLKSKYFRDVEGKRDGFPQIYSTLRDGLKAQRPMAGRPLGTYRAIWPVVISWTRAPTHTMFTDLLRRLSEECDQSGLEPIRAILRPPLILDYDSLFQVVTALPALRDAGLSLGPVLDDMLADRVHRPITVPTYLGSRVEGGALPDQWSEGLRRQVDRLVALGEGLRQRPAPGASRDGS